MQGKSVVANYIKITAIVILLLEICGILFISSMFEEEGIFVFLVGCAIVTLGFCLLYGVGEIIERLVSIDSKLKNQNAEIIHNAGESTKIQKDKQVKKDETVILPKSYEGKNDIIRILGVIAGDNIWEIRECKEKLTNYCNSQNLGMKVETRICGNVENRITTTEVEEAYAVIIAKNGEEYETETERFESKIKATVKISTLRDNCDYVVNQVLEKVNDIQQT